MNTTVENNKIIAEFMGLRIVGGHLQKYIDSNSEPKQYWEGVAKTFEHQIYGWQITHHESKIQYHSDWNWLMEVVEKIESLTNINTNGCFMVLESIGFNAKFILDDGTRIFNHSKGETKIEAVYTACVEFIEWYNEQEGK